MSTTALWKVQGAFLKSKGNRRNSYFPFFRENCDFSKFDLGVVSGESHSKSTTVLLFSRFARTSLIPGIGYLSGIVTELSLL